MKPCRRSSGNILAIVVAILFVLITLVLALHTNQAKAVREVTQAEAELQYRQAFEHEAAGLLATDKPLPDWVKVWAEADLEGELGLPLSYASKLWTDLPNLDPEGQEFAPGFQTYKMEPDTNDQALNVFSKQFQWMVAREGVAYAAYAPKGTITLERAVGWANPTFADEDVRVDEAYSGVPALLACLRDLEVQELEYGSAYSINGPITIGNESETAYGFQGSYPLRAYETALKQRLDSVKFEMEGAASPGNKTAQISGGVLQTAGTMFTMLFTGSGEPSLTLEQSWAVPFPMIPAFAQTIPNVFYEFWFHMPYPPDFASFDDPGGGASSEATGEKVKKLNEEVQALDTEIADLTRRINRMSDGSERDKLIDQRAEKRKQREEKLDQLEDIKKDLEEEGKKREDEIGRKSSGGPTAEPVTRRDDESIPKKTGIVGWCYSKVFENFLGLLVDTIAAAVTQDWGKIADRVKNDVRVVHFGDKDTEPEMRFDNGWYAKATFTVPPGRSFAYNGNLEFEGDLWLQKGSTMYVGGDLTLSNPNEGSLNPLAPSGKLVIEEGATLVVQRDLLCAGQTRYGSLWVASPPGRLSPVTTAIFVGGTADFPNGSFSATNIEDAVAWLAEKESSLDGVQDVVGSVLNDVAPNLGKIVGPFHRRRPFFASYATTFQLTIVYTPVGPIPVPSPIPLPRKNILVPIFRAMTWLYTPAMNYSLGENLYTQSDWWGFGDGVVPVMVKLDPKLMGLAFSSVSFSGMDFDIDWEDQLTEMSTTVMEGAITFVVETVAKRVIKEVIAAAIPFGSLATIVLDQVLDQLDLTEDSYQKLKDTVIDATLGPFQQRFEDLAENIEDQIEDGLAESYLRSITGPLIYADTILAGDGSTRLMAGMLVAQNNINIDTRVLVGSMTSFNGSVTAQRLYYNPNFTQASLYKPKPTPTNWLERGAEFRYGKNFADGAGATDIRTEVKQIFTEAWNR